MNYAAACKVTKPPQEVQTNNQSQDTVLPSRPTVTIKQSTTRFKLDEVSKCKNSPGSRICTAYVICTINNEHYILTHKRSRVMTNPLLYCSAGGSIDQGENSYNAALRELREETGFSNPPDGYLFFTTNQTKVAANYIFFCELEQIRNGVKGPSGEFKKEIDMDATFSDLKNVINLPNTGHCLMPIKNNLDHPNLYIFFKQNCEYILNNILSL